MFTLVIREDELTRGGSYMDTFEDEIKSSLPGCHNNHEFVFVSRMCGYERISSIKTVWGSNNAQRRVHMTIHEHLPSR
jgi:hypothetical protein